MQDEKKITSDLSLQATELGKLYAIRAEQCKNRFFDFFVEFWDIINPDDELEVAWYHEYLCDKIQAIIERAIAKLPKEKDVIINIPPGTSKSTIVSQMAGAWAWIHAPYFVIITSTNSHGLSLDQSLKSKQIVKSDRYNQYFQPHFLKNYGRMLTLTKDNEKEWRNNFGGIRYFTSVTGGIIGKHAHLLLADDLLEVEKANSEAARNKANRYVSKTLPTRKKNKDVTPTVMIMQRLHENDPTGYLLKLGKPIDLIKLPAEVTGDIHPIELRNNYIDGLLDPNRLNKHTLNEQKTELGTYDYAGQYEQEPTPKGGGKVKEKWFQFIDEDDLPLGLVWDLWIDGAYTKHTKNDPTGFMIAAFDKRKNRLYVRHADEEYMEMPDLLKHVPKYCNMYGVGSRSRVYIEPKASGHSLKQLITDVTPLSGVLIEGKLVIEGKESRLSELSPKVESGKVFLVKGSWTDKFISQITTFPRALHDEFVDLLGYACWKYFGSKKKKGVTRRN